jgi:hypothetical protein
LRHSAGRQPYYWVSLDEPRFDAEGDGPYDEAEIAGASLHALVDNLAPEA